MVASAASSGDAGEAGASEGGHPLGSPGDKKLEADGGVASGQVVDFIKAVLKPMVRARAVGEGGEGAKADTS